MLNSAFSSQVDRSGRFLLRKPLTRKPFAHQCSKDADNQLPSPVGNEFLPFRGKDKKGHHVRRYPNYDLDRECIRRLCCCRDAVRSLVEFCFVVSAVRYAILAHVLAQPASGIITASVMGCSC